MDFNYIWWKFSPLRHKFSLLCGFRPNCATMCTIICMYSNTMAISRFSRCFQNIFSPILQNLFSVSSSLKNYLCVFNFAIPFSNWLPNSCRSGLFDIKCLVQQNFNDTHINSIAQFILEQSPNIASLSFLNSVGPTGSHGGPSAHLIWKCKAYISLARHSRGHRNFCFVQYRLMSIWLCVGCSEAA